MMPSILIIPAILIILRFRKCVTILLDLSIKSHEKGLFRENMVSRIYQFSALLIAILIANYSKSTVFPHIVSSLELFPLLEQFPYLVRKLFKFSLHKRKLNAETTVFPHIIAAATILFRNFQTLKISNSFLINFSFM